MRQHQRAVVGQRQRARPRVEHLDGVHACASSWTCRNAMVMSVSAVISACQVAGSASIIALVRSCMLAGAALDQIGRQRERRARETDQRHLAQLGDQQRHRVGNRRDPLRFKAVHGRDIGGGADRVGDHRSDVGNDVQFDARAAQRHDDVGEQDRRVDPVPADRLQGDLADQLGVEAGLHHRVLGRAIRGTRASDRPAWRMNHTGTRLRLAASGGGQVGRLGQLATGTRVRVHRSHAPAGTPPTTS